MKPPPVLYVEDDDNDVLLMRRAWAWVGVENPLQVVTNGREALAYLAGEGPYVNRFDHALPGLCTARPENAENIRIGRASMDPVAIGAAGSSRHHLSSSKLPLDISAAHALGIDAYVVNPGTYEEWVAMVDNLNAYWLKSREPRENRATCRETTERRPMTGELGE